MEKIIQSILAKNMVGFNNIRKSDSGFTNIVYLVDDKYVIKVSKDAKTSKGIDKEIDFYKHNSLNFVPKYIADGQLDGYRYLIVKQLKGQSLYKVWHKLNDSEREDLVKQIAEILSDFHKQGFNYLPENKIYLNWKEKWKRSFDLNISILQKRNFDTSKLEIFAKTKLPTIMEEQKLGLVYNDAHFDNFIFDDGELKLIDFDRILYGSIDYEFLILKSMIDNPAIFANEEDEKNVKPEDYQKIMNLLKKFYPKLFNFKFLNDRVFVYQFIYNLGNAYEYDREDWISEELRKFQQHFNL